MAQFWKSSITLAFLGAFLPSAASTHEKPVVGLIPRAHKPPKMGGMLTNWDGAFITPVHVGHPDFANRGGGGKPK